MPSSSLAPLPSVPAPAHDRTASWAASGTRAPSAVTTFSEPTPERFLSRGEHANSGDGVGPLPPCRYRTILAHAVTAGAEAGDVASWPPARRPPHPIAGHGAKGAPGEPERVSGALDPAQTALGVPRRDHQVVRGCAQSREHDLAQVDHESVRTGRAAVRLDLRGGAGDLGVAQPEGRILAGIGGAAVQGDASVASKIDGAPGAAHHPKGEAVLCKLDLRAAETRRPVSSQRRHRVVAMHAEQVADVPSEIRLRGSEVAPGRHHLILAPKRAHAAFIADQ